MRALLTPEIAPRMGIVLFRPGSELMPLFMQGRVLLEPEPERYSSFASGAVPAASQPLADDPAVRAVFRNEAVIRRAGGVECLESWLLREKGCQWPHSDWHSENMTTMRHAPGAIRLCWHCDNQLRDQFTERLESMATDNCARWVLSVVRRDLGFDDSHVVTMPELCWWLVRNDLADALPESAARKALRLPNPVVPSVTRESDLVPSVPATSIIQDKAKKVLALKVDPESPESFMLRPKRRRWVNEKYTRWVKTQPCACCGKPADDPHHLIGHGQGGMGTKAHDLFVLPLCRKHHDELHADRRTAERFQKWVEMGVLTVTDGAEVDYRYILEEAKAANKISPVSESPIDPFGATGLSHDLADEDLNPVTIVQNFANMSDPMKELEAAIESGRFHHDGNPIMTWCIGNVVGKNMPGNDDLVKPVKEQAENKIDGAVALIMTIGRAMLKEPDDFLSSLDPDDDLLIL